MIRQARNSKCHCGSGKKAKKCCLLASSVTDQRFRNRFQSDLGHDESRMIAGIGGLPIYTAPEDRSIVPRWISWAMLAAIAASFAGALFTVIWR